MPKKSDQTYSVIAIQETVVIDTVPEIQIDLLYVGTSYNDAEVAYNNAIINAEKNKHVGISFVGKATKNHEQFVRTHGRTLKWKAAATKK